MEKIMLIREDFEDLSRIYSENFKNKFYEKGFREYDLFKDWVEHNLEEVLLQFDDDCEDGVFYPSLDEFFLNNWYD